MFVARPFSQEHGDLVEIRGHEIRDRDQLVANRRDGRSIQQRIA
jgi:hypothetical protein